MAILCTLALFSLFGAMSLLMGAIGAATNVWTTTEEKRKEPIGTAIVSSFLLVVFAFWMLSFL